jgi:NTP pyrophosphatase (non-canonical NTP hydrolase)
MNLVGKKMKGFWFDENKYPEFGYTEGMKKLEGVEGIVIGAIYGYVEVEFFNSVSYSYPLDLAMKHLKSKVKYRKLEDKVLEWAKEKGILEKGNPLAQSIKTSEEALELIQAVSVGNKEETIDALGDILVTIIIQAKMQNVDLLDCLESAYNVIAKRKGEMINGSFVKE